jgi:subtilisin family serine protease
LKVPLLLTAVAEDGLYYDFPQYTATFQPDCIMAVAALSPNDDTLTDFSNWGQSVRIAAPVSDLNSPC